MNPSAHALPRSLISGLALLVLAGCLAPDAPPPTDGPPEATVTPGTVPMSSDEGPSDEDPSEAGGCFASVVIPAVIETTTEQSVQEPAVLDADGTVVLPARIDTTTRSDILRERQEAEVETPCADVLTPQFIASVQRALTTRGYFSAAITGAFDDPTQAAIKRFQTDQGDVPTEILTLQSARTLGLVALPRSAFEGGSR